MPEISFKNYSADNKLSEVVHKKTELHSLLRVCMYATSSFVVICKALYRQYPNDAVDI